MIVYSHSALGFQGRLVKIEVDIRRGLPGFDVVGLPDSAVKEARERVRIAIKNSGFSFPKDRILVNLTPAGIRKEGTSYDLPIALKILEQSGQIPGLPPLSALCLGELQLDGAVIPVRGVLSGVACALEEEIHFFVVPAGNAGEARASGQGVPLALEHLRQLTTLFSRENMKAAGSRAGREDSRFAPEDCFSGWDIGDIKGQPFLKRGMEIAAAGRHHILFFGPPGSGKTMAAQRLATLLPVLSYTEALDLTRIWSLAGKLESDSRLFTTRPFRTPHHSSSMEGLVGGGHPMKPGEVSLAHNGILFLDECPEFTRQLIQSLREPIEDRRVSLVRAGQTYSYPAAFQLVMTANSCPCGNLGRDKGFCTCSDTEIDRYWKRVGGAVMDRIDMRIPLKPVDPQALLSPSGESSEEVRLRVSAAYERQKHRFQGTSFRFNGDITADLIDTFCPLESGVKLVLIRIISRLDLSSRALHSLIKIGRTIADLAGQDAIGEEHIMEAAQYRRFAGRDLYWKKKI